MNSTAYLVAAARRPQGGPHVLPKQHQRLGAHGQTALGRFPILGPHPPPIFIFWPCVTAVRGPSFIGTLAAKLVTTTRGGGDVLSRGAVGCGGDVRRLLAARLSHLAQAAGKGSRQLPYGTRRHLPGAYRCGRAGRSDRGRVAYAMLAAWRPSGVKSNFTPSEAARIMWAWGVPRKEEPGPDRLQAGEKPA
jgi:hypothetical protein